MGWKKNLADAPKETPENVYIQALLPDEDIPVMVLWREYDQYLKEETGEQGYWDYHENLLSEVLGGIQPDQLEDAFWRELDISPILALRNTAEPTI